MKVLVDSNLPIYLLNGDERVADFLNGLECTISAISELELFAKKDIQDQEIADIEELIKDCILI